MTRIVDEITFNDNVEDSKLPIRTIQGALISFRFPELVQELHRQLQLFAENPEYDPSEEPELSRGLDATDARTLRVVVHQLMVLQALGSGGEKETEYHTAGETVMAAYITTLGEFDKYELMPMYAARLSPEKAIAVMGKALVNFEGDVARREGLVRAMVVHGLDVDGCLKYTMELSLKVSEPQYTKSVIEGGLVFKGFAGEIEPEDRQLIRGLEWLMLGSNAIRGELICRACEVYKRFLR
jgi:nuclear pore complex protein Nup107